MFFFEWVPIWLVEVCGWENPNTLLFSDLLVALNTERPQRGKHGGNSLKTAQKDKNRTPQGTFNRLVAVVCVHRDENW